MTRREEEIGRHVAKTVFPFGVLVWVGLPHRRLDDAPDHLPVAADVDGDHRLNVEHVLRAVKRPGVEVGVVLQRNESKAATGFCTSFCRRASPVSDALCGSDAVVSCATTGVAREKRIAKIRAFF